MPPQDERIVPLPPAEGYFRHGGRSVTFAELARLSGDERLGIGVDVLDFCWALVIGG